MLLSSTLLWCCFFFNLAQFVILENLSILDSALLGLKGLKKRENVCSVPRSISSFLVQFYFSDGALLMNYYSLEDN